MTVEAAAGFGLTRYSCIFFIQKSKFQSVSCSVPFLRPLTGMQLLQSLRVRLFLAKEF